MDSPDRKKVSLRGPWSLISGLHDEILEGDTSDLEYRPGSLRTEKSFGSCLRSCVPSRWFERVRLDLAGPRWCMREYRPDPAVLLFNRVKRLGIEATPAEVRRTPGPPRPGAGDAGRPRGQG